MTDIGDIVELKNVLGHSLASAELVAGTGGVSVLQRLTNIEGTSGTNIEEIKNAIGFDSMPPEWKSYDTTESLLSRMAKLPVEVIKLIVRMYANTDEARQSIQRDRAASTIYNTLSYGPRGQRSFGNANRQLSLGVSTRNRNSNYQYFRVKVLKALRDYKNNYMDHFMQNYLQQSQHLLQLQANAPVFGAPYP
eukprot:scaffold8718_cov159-Isochrysis_galbana.AAC.3